VSLDLSDVPAAFGPAVVATLDRAGVSEGHVAVELVDEQRIHDLNLRYRDRDRPTDVLSFPIDEQEPGPGPRELGDVIVCEQHCEDVTEAVVHGVLHLCGYDHETDDGEMLAIQDEIMAGLAGDPGDPAGLDRAGSDRAGGDRV
jgi:probable rRNA maturation factor